jgi:riboflavin kinase/FMN adenylyltransferase
MAELIQGLSAIPSHAMRGVLTIGNFDGVHVGHQRILAAARQLADKERTKLVVLTFDPPPAAVLAPQQAPELITPIQEKCRLLEQQGVDAVVAVQTTPEFLAISPPQFVQEVIIEKLAPRHIVEGPGFFFGRGRSGNVHTLREMAAIGHFSVTEVPPVSLVLPGLGPTRVSSSLIRTLIVQGELASAQLCLTRPFTLFGQVVAGEGRGRLLDFPTANVDTGRMVVPADGVYAGRARVAELDSPAAISIGLKPTFSAANRCVEVHLLEPPGDLYDKPIAVTFLARLRDQRKFPDAASLRRQIAKDIQRVREICR